MVNVSRYEYDNYITKYKGVIEEITDHSNEDYISVDIMDYNTGLCIASIKFFNNGEVLYYIIKV